MPPSAIAPLTPVAGSCRCSGRVAARVPCPLVPVGEAGALVLSAGCAPDAPAGPRGGGSVWPPRGPAAAPPSAVGGRPAAGPTGSPAALLSVFVTAPSA